MRACPKIAMAIIFLYLLIFSPTYAQKKGGGGNDGGDPALPAYDFYKINDGGIMPVAS